MTRLKPILGRLFFLPLPVLVLLVPVAAALLIYAFVCPQAHPAVVYGSYALSAYALTALCVRIPQLYRGAKSLKQNNPHLSRYFGSAGLRVRLSLTYTLAGNLFYALLQLCLGFLHHSIWFYALAGYYALLSILRSFLLRETRKNRLGKHLHREYALYRFCGVLLVPMNLTLAVVVAFIVWQNRGFSYHPIATIALAAYTFFSLTMAIIQLVRYRKYNSPVLSASKCISLVAALVSMLSLETAMLSAFGTQDQALFRQIMTASTGGAVCTAVLVTAVAMILRANKEIKAYKGGSRHGEP